MAISAGVVSTLGVLVHPFLVAMRNKERQRDRDLLQALAREKLDVLKSAIAAGYDEEQLAQLDRRLAKLLGSEQFRSLVEEIGTYEQADGTKTLDTPLLATELTGLDESDGVYRGRAKAGQKG
jgi:hypothetical protein